MKCPKCSKEIPDGSKFCLECGSNIFAISGASSLENKGDVSLSGLKTVSGLSSAPPPDPGDVSIGDIRTVDGIKSGEGSIVIKVIKDRYELCEEIGHGGFAVVYKGRDIKLDRTIAVKVLSPQNQVGGDASAVERFQRESSIIASLNHRNILTVFDCDKDDEAGFFIVMEYIDGGTLREYLKEKIKLGIDEASLLIKGICRGMSYAHRKNLVHRDLKPANVMLALDGDEIVPKIVDFGLARSGGGSEISISGYGMGTPYYMPPEQRRDAKSVNHTADIYAIGKIFYELLTGEIPDNIDTEKLPPECHGLARIITRCVKSKPEERYFSVDELMAEIEKATSSSRIESLTETKISIDGSNVCPQCSTYNSPGTKFCEKCGAGLTRICPECGAESSIHSKHCPSCGTDIEVFLTVTSALEKMERYSADKKWSRVVKEATLLPAAMSFPKEKGKNLISDVRELESTAKGKIEKEGKLRAQIQSELDKKNYAPALKMAKELLEDNPDEIEYKELIGEISQAYLEQKKMNAKELFDKMEYEKAFSIVREVLKDQPGDEECVQLKDQITKKITEISSLRKMRKFRATAIGVAIVVVIIIGIFAIIKYSCYRTYNSNFSQAHTAFAAKDFGTAVKFCEEALKVKGYKNDAIAKKFLEEALRITQFDSLIGQGKKYIDEENWVGAEKAFASAISIPGYENDGEARDNLKKCRDIVAEFRIKNKVEYEKSVSEGAKALSEKNYEKALNLFEATLKVPGYENDNTAISSLKSAQEGLEMQRKQSEVVWNETKTKVNGLLSNVKNDSQDIAKRIESADSALALLENMSSLLPSLSPVSSSEIAALKSEITSLQSKLPRIPSGFEMVKGTDADTDGWASEIRHTASGIEMVYVAPGTFMMGSPASEVGRRDEETQHKVTLTKGYYIGKYEVTQGQWEKVMGDNPSSRRGINLPVVSVSWDDCQSFCKKLGSGFRLPTEAEWEYAARGGNRSKGFIYSGSNNLDEVGWYWSNNNEGKDLNEGGLFMNIGVKFHEIGQKKPNEIGIYDMSGSVWEWCQDWYGREYPSGSLTDPMGPKTGWDNRRVQRGGSWTENVMTCRVSNRAYSSPWKKDSTHTDFGVRVVFTPPVK